MIEAVLKESSTLSPKAPRFIAHYLPQFHPIPENDQWWGNGFTEWTNVTRARPQFRGHYQPHLPADLGFYDLRVPEVREAQAELARQYGIHGFMYYHYWFHGKRLIERPFQDVLDSGRPDFPFCLCWANETWSRRWLGEEKEILIRQDYSREDFRNHARWLSRAFADPRYIRVAGRPVFVIYRYSGIPSDLQTTAILRDDLKREGADDPYLIAVDCHAPDFDFRSAGFDHSMAFEPALHLPQAFEDQISIARWFRNRKLGVNSATLKLYDYEEAIKIMKETGSRLPRIPCVLVSFDNSPRRGKKGIIFQNCHPEKFGKVLESRLDAWVKEPPGTDLFFLNAWNEWAEGNHLEPDQKFGLGYLNALRQVHTRASARYGWRKIPAANETAAPRAACVNV